jgi:uncharacterized protein (DUF1015 family)
LADVQPLQAIRYAPNVDLSRVICPPFDTISPEEHKRLHELSPYNAVRLELPKGDGDPYQAAAKSLHEWLNRGTLVRDEAPAFYVYQQEFRHRGKVRRRRTLFGRLRLEPWDQGTVLPHEQTFRAPREERSRLIHSLRLNTSPVFLVYPDSQHQVAPLVARAVSDRPGVEFADSDGLSHALWRINDSHLAAAIARGLERQRLYVADGHHRYETALAYRDERLGGSGAARSGDEPEEFVLAALAAADDPALLVLPIHRLVNVDVPLERALASLKSLFRVEVRPSLAELLRDMRGRGRTTSSFGLVAADSPDFYLLTLFAPEVAESHLPSERAPIWHRLDAAIASHLILHHALGLSHAQMEDIGTVWYGEDSEAIVAEVRQGRARYGLLLNPVSPGRILAVADTGERMPQKSTFFYPKLPTGLLFYPLFQP